MCGILGKISLKNRIDNNLMLTSLNLMEHRGPDSFGVWYNEDGSVWFGHRRLSIIDLSSLGSQPMLSFDSNLIIVFNGEIYNHIELKKELISNGYIFNSSSDTEVLLNSWHFWGCNSLSKIEGMFAFAILDQSQKKLFIVRDRIGEKPLYYKQTKDAFLFASELKSILCSDNSNNIINSYAFDCLLGFGYIPQDLCIVDGIKKLPPSSFLTLDISSNNLNVEKYWQPPLPSSILKDDTHILTKLDHIFRDSVKSQMISDVPIGVMLSGGLDSSLVTAYASDIDQDIFTFTVGFEGYGGADERFFARQVAQWFGTQHRELNITGADPEIMTLLAEQCCEPSTDPAIIPGYLIYKAASSYCKVVMGGDGGDEIFGGYDRYEQWIHLKDSFGNYPIGFRSLISKISESFIPVGFKGRHYLMQLSTDFDNSIPFTDTLFTRKDRVRLLPDFWNVQDTYEVKNKMIESSLSFFDRAMRYDLNGFLPENILSKVDRSSMLSSVEVRSPFLSSPLIEFAMRDIGPDLKRRKKILRSLAHIRIPNFINTQRKQGFIPPLEFWMKEKKWQIFIKDHLFSSSTIFNKKMLNELFKLDSKLYFNKRRLFSLIMIQLWLNKYKINLS